MTAAAPAPEPGVHTFRRSLAGRLKAAGIQLAVSALIVAGALYLALEHWYPGFHFAVDGGGPGVRIIAGVDLVLGPLLTAVFFNPFKARRLIAFDLACTSAARLAALAWGLYAIHAHHPVAIGYHEGSFHSVTRAPLDVESYDVARLAELSDRRPALVFVAAPATEDEQVRAAFQMLIGKVMPHEDPFFFRRFADHWAEVRGQAVDPAQRAKESAVFAEALAAFVAQRNAQAGDFLYFPYEGRQGTCTLAFTPAGNLVDALGCTRF